MNTCRTVVNALPFAGGATSMCNACTLPTSELGAECWHQARSLGTTFAHDVKVVSLHSTYGIGSCSLLALVGRVVLVGVV